MKHFFSIAVVIITMAASCQQKQGGKTFTVEGQVRNTTASMVYLEENVPNNRPTILDSAKLGADGSFALKAKGREESMYQLRMQGKMVPFALLINDTEKINIIADPENTTQPYTVQNSPATQDLLLFDQTAYEKGMQLFVRGSKVDSLQKASAPDSVIGAAYGRVEETAAELKSFVHDFLSKSKSPVLTLYAISSYQNTASNLGIRGFSNIEMAGIVNTTAERFPQHTALQNVKKSLPSTKAKDFTQPDASGNPVSLSQFKGKYVLVDFWASWCKPCRMDNPNVVKAYNEFKDKNFTVLGVSLDQSKDAWLKAIQQDGLTWTHVSDLQFWNNAAATLYSVQSIPYNILVDPSGEIIAENLHGDEIVQTLRRVVK
jgi:peroxiredoxin